MSTEKRLLLRATTQERLSWTQTLIVSESESIIIERKHSWAKNIVSQTKKTSVFEGRKYSVTLMSLKNPIWGSKC